MPRYVTERAELYPPKPKTVKSVKSVPKKNGDPGNDIEKKRVDIKFYSDLVTKAGMKKWCAAAFLSGVRIGGTEEFGLSFSWGFAHK